MGLRPAILTRGYGGFGSGRSKQTESDEVTLLREKCIDVPIGVGVNRFESAERILRESPVDVFLLDDGFQHWSLARELDIVCIDATDPWGGGAMVPAGRLREPIISLSRAHIAVVTRSELVSTESLSKIVSKIKEMMPAGVVVASHFQSAGLPEILGNKKILAVSALGNPRAFELGLRNLGADVIPMRFNDHYTYRESDLEEMERLQVQHNALIVTTEKDWMKMKRLSWGNQAKTPASFHVLKITLEFTVDDERLWLDRLRKTFS